MDWSVPSAGPARNSGVMLVTERSLVSHPAPDWDFRDPHVVTLQVVASDIDAYNHFHNAVYLSWFDRVAWSHSASLGISLEECVRLRRGMAAHRTEIDYARAAVLGDRVRVGTWIV